MNRAQRNKINERITPVLVRTILINSLKKYDCSVVPLARRTPLTMNGRPNDLGAASGNLLAKRPAPASGIWTRLAAGTIAAKSAATTDD
jgi:hypothetical protein